MGGKKLEGNGLWESSRMMLPEHKAVLIAGERESMRLPRKELDEQEKQLISAALHESFVRKADVTLNIYTPYLIRTQTGKVTKLQRDSVRLNWVDPFQGTEEYEWVSLSDLVKAELKHEWIEEEMYD